VGRGASDLDQDDDGGVTVTSVQDSTVDECP